MATGVGLALSTTVGVVDGVHRRTAGLGADAAVAVPARFSDDHVGKVLVADSADGGHTFTQNVTHFARRQTQGDILAVPTHNLGVSTGGAGYFATLSGIHLNIVNQGTDGDVFEFHGVAGLDVEPRFGRQNGITHLQALGLEDVALLAVDVVDQADPAVAVGIVLDGGNPALDAELVPLEIDDPVEFFGSGFLVAGSDPAIVVPPGMPGQLFEQTPHTCFGGYVVALQRRHKTT